MATKNKYYKLVIYHNGSKYVSEVSEKGFKAENETYNGIVSKNGLMYDAKCIIGDKDYVEEQFHRYVMSKDKFLRDDIDDCQKRLVSLHRLKISLGE